MRLVPPSAFVDANILFSQTLRDWISIPAWMTDEALYRVRFSEDVLAEWVYRMRRKKPELSDVALGGIRRRLEKTFPDGMVTGYSPADVPCTRDPNDRHVLAAAVHCQADYLVTDDSSGFPEDCVEDRLDVLTADEFLNWVADTDMALMIRVLNFQLEYWKTRRLTDEYTAHDLIAYLRKAKVPRFAQRIEAHLDLEAS